MLDGSKRARDADRQHAVDLIDDAFVDGQLTQADHELRVERALSAVTVDELEALVRDLQSPPDAVAASPRPRRRGRLVAAVAAVLVIGGAVWLWSTDDESASPAPVVQAQPAEPVAPIEAPPSEAPEPEVEEPPEPAPFDLTAENVRKFRRLYEAKVGTFDTYSLSLHRHSFAATVPVRGRNARAERWDFWGRKGLEKSGDPSAVTVDEKLFSWSTLNIEAMMSNLKYARTELNLERPNDWYILVRPDYETGVPELAFYIYNKYDEAAYLHTTLAGRITERDPFDPHNP